MGHPTLCALMLLLAFYAPGCISIQAVIEGDQEMSPKAVAAPASATSSPDALNGPRYDRTSGKQIESTSNRQHDNGYQGDILSLEQPKGFLGDSGTTVWAKTPGMLATFSRERQLQTRSLSQKTHRPIVLKVKHLQSGYSYKIKPHSVDLPQQPLFATEVSSFSFNPADVTNVFNITEQSSQRLRRSPSQMPPKPKKPDVSNSVLSNDVPTPDPDIFRHNRILQDITISSSTEPEHGVTLLDYVNNRFAESTTTGDVTQSLDSAAPRRTLHIGGLFELSGKYSKNGDSELNAAMLAINHINDQHIIPGYRLELLYNDSKCDPGYGTDAFFDFIYRKSNESSLIMVMGSACTEVTKTIAEIVPYWNLILSSAKISIHFQTSHRVSHFLMSGLIVTHSVWTLIK